MGLPIKSIFANRGQTAEKAVHKCLDIWAKNHLNREYSRLTDSKAAGRTIKAADADFAFYCNTVQSGPRHGLIEVKETAHPYRLERSRLTQLPRLRKREACGGDCVVLIFHSGPGLWRFQTVGALFDSQEKGSWDFKGVPIHASPADALAAWLPEVFGPLL